MATAAEGLPEAGAQPAKRKGPGRGGRRAVSGSGPWPRGRGRVLPCQAAAMLPAQGAAARRGSSHPAAGKGSGSGVGTGCGAGPRLQLRARRPAGCSPACIPPGACPATAPLLRSEGAAGLGAAFVFKLAKVADKGKGNIPA